MNWIVILKCGAIYRIQSESDHIATFKKWLLENTSLHDRHFENMEYYLIPDHNEIIRFPPLNLLNNA